MAGRAEVVGAILIEIESDVGKFATRFIRDLKAQVKAASRNADVFEPLVRDAERAGASAGRKFSTGLRREAGRGGGFGAAGRRAGGVFGRFFSAGATDAAGGVGPASFLGRLTSGLTSLGETVPGVSQLSGVLQTLGTSSGPAGLAAVAAMAPAFAGLVFQAIGLAGYLARIIGLIGVLPSAAAVTVAAIVPLVVAFQGFGGAVAAVASGDPKKIDAALRKLSPSARQVARDVGGLTPQLRKLRESTQEAFFRELLGDIKPLAATLLPSLTKGFALVAGVIGKISDKGLEALAKPEVAAGLDKIFATTGQILAMFAGPLGDLAGAFGHAIIAALPALMVMSGIFARMIESFSGKFQEFIASGKFEDWIMRAIEAGGDLKDLVMAVLELFGTLFSFLGDDGKSTLQTITELVRDLNEIIKDPEVQESIKGTILLFKGAAVAVLIIVAAITELILALGYAIQKAKELYDWLMKIAGLGKKETVLGKVGPQGLQTAFQPGAGGGAAGPGGFRGFAAGGVVDRPTLAMMGEGGKREAVLPLDHPARAAEILAQAGIGPGLFTGGGLSIQVWLGDQEISDIVAVKVNGAMAQTARQVRTGPREA